MLPVSAMMGNSVEWVMESKCNLKCIHCVHSCALPYSDLSSDQKFHIIDRLYSMGIRRISFNAMEPLITPDVIKIFAYCRYLGIAVSVTTNGTPVNERMAKELSRKNVLYVAVSLEGLTEKTNDVVRGKGNFKRAVNGICILKRWFEDNSNRLFIQICLTPFNVNEIEKGLDDFWAGSMV